MPNPSEVAFPTRKERHEDRRKEGTQRKLLDEFFDHPTLLAISRLVSQGQFETIDYPISTGKEGGVFRASGPDGYRAVKVYRVGNSVFRRLPPYVLDELKHTASVGNFSRLVYAWTRREHTVLRKLRAADVRCPTPYGYLRNVLVMEFIGAEGFAAPRLRDAEGFDPTGVYADLVDQIRRMTHSAHLVHGDLSPYNVLYHLGHVVPIDVGQAIASDHPQARSLLLRDIGHFAKFLVGRGADVTAETFAEAVGADRVGPAGG